MAGRHRKQKNRQLTTGKYALAGTLASVGIATMAANSGTASAATDNEWNKVAQCESSNNWEINTGNGFYGGLQFKQSTWQSYGGTQFAQRADLASRSQQIAIAERVLHAQGKRAWPVCGRRLSYTPYTGLPSGEYSHVLPGPETQSGQYATGFTGLIQSANQIIDRTIDGLVQSHAGAPGFAIAPRSIPKPTRIAPQHAAIHNITPVNARFSWHPRANIIRAPHNIVATRYGVQTRTLDSQLVHIHQAPQPPVTPPVYPGTYPPGPYPPGQYPPPVHGRHLAHPDPRFRGRDPRQFRAIHNGRGINEHHLPPRGNFHGRGAQPLPGHGGPVPAKYIPTPGLHQVPAPNPADSVFSLNGQTPNINPNALGDVLNALGAANAHIDPQMLFSNPGQYIPNVARLLGNNNTNIPAAKGAEGIAQFVNNITKMLGTGPTQSMTNGAPIIPGVGPLPGTGSH